MKNIRFSNFYIRTGLFGILSMAGAFFNYLLYPVLVRILNSSDFGDFAAIVAISNQVLGILLAFNIISIYLVKTQPKHQALAHTQIIQKYLIWLFLILTIVVIAASPFLRNLLNIQEVSSFGVLGAILVIAVPSVVWTGYLQGHKELVRIGVYTLSSSVAKLILASVLATILGTIGAVWGMLGGAVVGLTVLSILPGVKLPSLSILFTRSRKQDVQFVLGLRHYFIECIFVVGALSFLQNYDITLAKALFDPNVAGTYSGISVISNALYYISFLLIWVVLPELKVGDNTNNYRVLGTAYKLLSGIVLLSVLGIFVFREKVLHILLGANFSQYWQTLLFAILYQLTLVAIVLYGYYLLVTRQRRANLLSLLAFVSCIFLPARFGHSPKEMIILLWISLLMSFAVYWVFVELYKLFYKRPLR